MKGKIIFRGNKLDFDGVNDLPLQTVKAYAMEFPNATISDVMNFFNDGLKGGAKNFIIEVINYSGDNRYITRETIQLKDDKGNSIDCYVSSQFGNSGPQENLSFFVDHIRKCGFVVKGYIYPYSKTPTYKASKVGGYNIIDIRKYPILQELREALFNKNNKAFDLMDKLDTSGLLMSEGVNNWGMFINEALKSPEYILFSSDKPKRKYGKYNKGDLIKSIGDLMSKIAKSSLSDEQKKTLNDVLMELLRIVCQFSNEDCNEEESFMLKNAIVEINNIFKDIEKDIIKDILDSLNELDKIINGLEFKRSLFGVHLDGTESNNQNGPVVILFLNNILYKTQGNETFDRNELYDSYPNINSDIERTYVHELFHMIHLGMEILVYNNDYADTVVIEGLARYFEIMYSELYLGTNARNDLDKLFKKTSVVSYPYTGACYIDRFDKKRFGEIVEKSTYENHMAAHCLLQGTKELEIIIKNL